MCDRLLCDCCWVSCCQTCSLGWSQMLCCCGLWFCKPKILQQQQVRCYCCRGTGYGEICCCIGFICCATPQIRRYRLLRSCQVYNEPNDQNSQNRDETNNNKKQCTQDLHKNQNMQMSNSQKNIKIYENPEDQDNIDYEKQNKYPYKKPQLNNFILTQQGMNSAEISNCKINKQEEKSQQHMDQNQTPNKSLQIQEIQDDIE